MTCIDCGRDQKVCHCRKVSRSEFNDLKQRVDELEDTLADDVFDKVVKLFEGRE